MKDQVDQDKILNENIIFKIFTTHPLMNMIS